MEKHLKDEELNHVTGGVVDYATCGSTPDDQTGDPLKNSNPSSNTMIRAVCATCNVEYTGTPSSVQSKVDMHMNTTNHAYFTYHYA